jgi:hypothetical protein
MKIPVHKLPDSIDFSEFMRELNKKYGWDHRDMAGSHSKEAYAERDKLKSAWMAANGYAGKEYVLDEPKGGSKKAWPQDSEEMKLRIEINSKYRESGQEEKDERPYQDFWHWLLENDFSDLHRGGINFLSFESIDEECTPDFVKKILVAIQTEVMGHAAYDEGGVHFFVDW